jgi:hypothetical protein
MDRIYSVTGDAIIRDLIMGICRPGSELDRRILIPNRQPYYVPDQVCLNVDRRTGRASNDYANESSPVEVSRQSLNDFVMFRLSRWKRGMRLANPK